MCCPDEAIHPIEKNMAIVCLLLNIFICPGLGTIVHAVMGTNAGQGIIYGILQFITTPLFLAGWIWGIVYGVKILNKSNSHHGASHDGHYTKEHEHH